MPSILLPFDASPAAARAVDFLAAYGAVHAALAIDVLNVQPAPLTLWPQAQPHFGAIRSSLLEAGRTTIDSAVRRLAETGAAATTAVRIGLPAETIIEEARARDVAAIVMGTRGQGAVRGFAIGSVALRVAHGGVAPVILMKPEDRLPAAPGRRLRVLLAVDGSESPVRAVERLVTWRDWLGKLDVQLAWVQEPLTYLEMILPPHDDVIRHWSAKEGDQAAQAARAVLARAGIAHEFHVVAGDPALELAALAERTGAELMALGTRGLGAAHHAFLGSVALKVCALDAVPTLLVP